jgi:hypothetical protein
MENRIMIIPILQTILWFTYVVLIMILIDKHYRK